MPEVRLRLLQIAELARNDAVHLVQLTMRAAVLRGARLREGAIARLTCFVQAVLRHETLGAIHLDHHERARISEYVGDLNRLGVRGESATPLLEVRVEQPEVVERDTHVVRET